MSTELITTDERPVANDLRHAVMSLPVAQQDLLLQEYQDRRNNFRAWLRARLEEGVHFGFPPGCRASNADPKQWQSQPSLYAAGADLLCDLLGLRCEFAADVESWQQLGAKPGHFVLVCKLYSRATGELIGEGRGVRREGQKGGDANNAIKMAQKSAKVDAVLNAYGLRDVFSQDLENPPQPPHDNPEANTTAPKTAPRAKREAASAEGVKPEHIKDILGNWRGLKDSVSDDPEKDRRNYITWVAGITGREFDALKVSQWRKADVVACCGALGIVNPWEETP